MTEKILAILFVLISKVIAVTGYAGIALLMAIESACIPLPSELIMPFGGYLVFTGVFKLFWVATAGAIAACDPHVHRVAGGNRAHAPRPFSPLYILRFVAVVLRTGLAWHEAR